MKKEKQRKFLNRMKLKCHIYQPGFRVLDFTPSILLFPSPLRVWVGDTYGVSTYGQNLQHRDGASCPTKSAAETQDPRSRTIPTGFEDLVPPVMQIELPSGAQQRRLEGWEGRGREEKREGGREEGKMRGREGGREGVRDGVRGKEARMECRKERDRGREKD